MQTSTDPDHILHQQVSLIVEQKPFCTKPINAVLPPPNVLFCITPLKEPGVPTVGKEGSEGFRVLRVILSGSLAGGSRGVPGAVWPPGASRTFTHLVGWRPQ